MSKYNKQPFNEFGGIYQKTQLFSSIKDTCSLLDKLNNALHECIPEEYIGLCHFGAIDYTKELPILFVNEPQIFHKLNAMSEHILRHLHKKHFNFSKILFKTKIASNNQDTTPKYKILNPSEKQQLYKLANLINKPELVVENVDAAVDNEIDL